MGNHSKTQNMYNILYYVSISSVIKIWSYSIVSRVCECIVRLLQAPNRPITEMGIIPDLARIVLCNLEEKQPAFIWPAALLLKSRQPMSLCLSPWSPDWTATWRRKRLFPVRTPWHPQAPRAERPPGWASPGPGVHKRQQSLCWSGRTRDVGEPIAVVTIHNIRSRDIIYYIIYYII